MNRNAWLAVLSVVAFLLGLFCPDAAFPWVAGTIFGWVGSSLIWQFRAWVRSIPYAHQLPPALRCRLVASIIWDRVRWWFKHKTGTCGRKGSADPASGVQGCRYCMLEFAAKLGGAIGATLDRIVVSVLRRTDEASFKRPPAPDYGGPPL